MTKKLILEIPYPETIIVDAPVLWKVPYVGSYNDIYKVYLIEHIIKWFQNSKNLGQTIIDDGMTSIEIVVDGLINRFDKKHLDDHYMKREISHFLFQYRYYSGLSLADYKFNYEVECNGKKLGIVDKPYKYDDELDLVKVLIHNYTSSSLSSCTPFKYKIESE